MRNKILKNLILFLFGYCLYIALEVTWRGFSFVLMGIVGGLAFIFIDKINDFLSWDVDLLLQGCIGSGFITFMELLIGEYSKVNPDIIPVMWNYSNMPLNFDGVICLPFSLLWICLSIVAVFVIDAINYYILGEKDVIPYYTMFGKHLFSFTNKVI